MISFLLCFLILYLMLSRALLFLQKHREDCDEIGICRKNLELFLPFVYSATDK